MSKRFLLSLILAFASVFFIASPTFAEGVDMKISPVSNYFYIKAGDIQNYTLTISNKGDSEFTYQLYASPYTITDDDYTMSFDEKNSTNYNQITRWVKFKDNNGNYVENPQYRIQPGEEQTISYRITVPDSIPSGGQYCVIFAETVRNGEPTSSGIATISRVALTLVGHGTGDTIESGEIPEYWVTAPFSGNGISAGATIKNSGNTDFEASYLFAVSSIFDKELYTSNSSYTILPETQRRITVAWENAPMFGVYKTRFAIIANDAIKDETKLVIIMPTWILIIIIFLLTIITIWIIILIRKRKERSTRLVV